MSLLLGWPTAQADEYATVDRLVGAGRWSEAVQRADEYLASHPKDARMRFIKGLALTEQGRLVEATSVFVKLTEDHPERPEPFNNLAVLYSKQGQYEQAKRALEQAIRANPGYGTAYENLGDVYAKLAGQAYSKALQVEGANTASVRPKLEMIRDLLAPKAMATPAPRPPTAPVASSTRASAP